VRDAGGEIEREVKLNAKRKAVLERIEFLEQASFIEKERYGARFCIASVTRHCWAQRSSRLRLEL
jgi:hypothetical protein